MTANFGASGAGPASDPDAYFTGQYHVGTDFAAIPGREVRAPVAGEIVYYHRLRNSPPEPRWLDSFFVLRDGAGRDWIFAHTVCTICPDHPDIGDAGTWTAAPVPVAAGAVMGEIADLAAEGFGNHLHLGLVDRPIVVDGQLLEAYRYANWARMTYSDGTEGAVEGARAVAASLGFVDPMTVLSVP